MIIVMKRNKFYHPQKVIKNGMREFIEKLSEYSLIATEVLKNIACFLEPLIQTLLFNCCHLNIFY